MKALYRNSFFYLITGLVMGVFYREFTKFNEFDGVTALSKVHVHSLVLGFIFFLILMVVEKQLSFTNEKGFKLWLISYNIGLLGLLATLTTRGIGQVLSLEMGMLSHVAGLFHTILGIALVWFMIIVKKAVFK